MKPTVEVITQSVNVLILFIVFCRFSSFDKEIFIFETVISNFVLKLLKRSSECKNPSSIIIPSTKFKHLVISRVKDCKCIGNTLAVDKMLSRNVRILIMLKEQNWFNRP